MPDRIKPNSGSRIRPDEEPQRWHEVKPDEEPEKEEAVEIFEDGSEPIRASFDSAGGAIAEADGESLRKSFQASPQAYEPPYESGDVQTGQRAEEVERDTGRKLSDPAEIVPPAEEDAA